MEPAAPVYLDLTPQQLALVHALEPLIASAKFARRNNKNNFKGSTGYGFSHAFGFIRRRSRVPGPSRCNAKYPELWEGLKALGATLGLQWDAVQVNKDCVCNPHKDKNNEGLSLLISGGDYTGGELVTSFGNFLAKYRGVVFDGSQIEHSNTPTVGYKWSIVFFSITMPPDPAGYFPALFRGQYPYYRDRFLDHIPERERLYFPNGIRKNIGKPNEYVTAPV